MTHVNGLAAIAALQAGHTILASGTVVAPVCNASSFVMSSLRNTTMHTVLLPDEVCRLATLDDWRVGS